MKRLLAAILLGALLWSGYWAWGAWSLTRATEAWFAARDAEGWQADVADVALRGFPNRFDQTFTDVHLTDPDTGLGWQAAFFQLFRLSYRPSHLIAVWPPQQRLIWPDGGLTVTSDQMQASFVVAGTEQSLDRVTLVADVLNVAHDAGGSFALARAQMSARTLPGVARYQIAFAADGFVPSLPAGFVADTLPAAFETLTLNAQVTFDRAWDQSALNDQRPQPKSIDLTLAEAAWDTLGLKAKGKLDLDDAGIPTGELALQVRNWQQMLALARASGQMPPAVLTGLEQGLTVLSRLNGNAKTLDVTLEFVDGRVFAGPLPIGRSPIIQIR